MPDPKDNADPVEGLVDRALQELVAEGAAAVSEHPDVEDLVAFQEGRLEAAAAEAVQRHLVVCPQCARDVLDLGSFDEDHDPALEPSAERLEAAWDSLQKNATSRSPGPFDDRPNPQLLRILSAPRGLVALAASALLVGVALGYLFFSSDPAGGGSAQRAAKHPFLFDPPPAAASQRRSPDSVRRFEIPPETDPLIARLNLADQTPYGGGYRVVAKNEDDAVVFQRDDVRRHPEGYFLVELPSEDFPEGEYQLILRGVQHGVEVDLDTYRFELLATPSP